MEAKLTKDEKKAIRQEEWKEKVEKERKNSLYKTVVYWSLGSLLVILALWALVSFSNGNTTATSSTGISIPAIKTTDFQEGSPSAKVTLVEYADFQCPACKAYFPIVKQLQTTEGTNLRFVYRFFPLKTIHRNGINSARAAYAASKQGKFWEMHDMLFETQDTWAEMTDPETTFIGYVKTLNLNADQFKKDYESDSTITFINNAYDVDTNIGLNATPTFFVNGKQLISPNGYQDLKNAVDSAMK